MLFHIGVCSYLLWVRCLFCLFPLPSLVARLGLNPKTSIHQRKNPTKTIGGAFVPRPEALFVDVQTLVLPRYRRKTRVKSEVL
jgi:hypothetical protein